MSRRTLAALTGAAVAAFVGVYRDQARWNAYAAGTEPPGITACAGADLVLRIAAANGTCPAGTSPVKLGIRDTKPDPPDCDDCDPLHDPASKPPSADARLAALEQRIENLEKAPVFEVVDSTGSLIYRVSGDAATLYSRDGTAVAGMVASDTGGVFVVKSADGRAQRSVTLGVSGGNVGLRFMEGGKVRLDMIRNDAGGNFALKVPGSSATGAIAGIGESRVGTGAMVAGDKSGSIRASLSIDTGKGAATVFNGGGIAIVAVREAVTGGGIVMLGNSSGAPAVKMVTPYDRYGAVLTGPGAGFPYVPHSGLPGSYMLGCAAGPTCLAQ